MIRLDNTMMKDQSMNLQKIFQNIIAVVLLDVKNQLSHETADLSIHNFQNILEKSLTTKLQEEEFLAIHLKDFEQSIFTEYNPINEESLPNEKSVLEIKLKETQEKYDEDIKLKCHVITLLKRELKEKENALKNQTPSYEDFMKDSKELTIANANVERLENENKELKRKLKCRECSFVPMKKNVEEINLQKEIAKKKSIDLLQQIKDEYVVKDVDVSNYLDKQATEEKILNLKKLDIVIENYKHVVDRTQEEISEKESSILDNTLNLSTLRSQVGLLTEKVDELKCKEVQAADDNDLKEGKIISLQSTIDKMKINLLECKAKEHNVVLQLDCANVTINKLQKAVESLQKEKEKMHHNAEKNNLKSSFIQQQWDTILTITNNKDDEMLRLKNEKKAMLHNLKEKNMLLSSQDVECEKIRNDIDCIRRRYAKAEKSLFKTRNDYVELEKAHKLLQYEKSNLEVKFSERDRINENQVTDFVMQLYVSEDELNAEEFTQSIKGMNITAIAQKVISKQRSELASLKTNIQWLKEALQVSGKDRFDLQNHLVQNKEHLVKLETEIKMLEQTNKQLNANIKEQQEDSTKLQTVLENAVVSYTNVCSLFEEQEKVLQMERESYISKIVDLHKKLKKETSIKANLTSAQLPNSDLSLYCTGDLRFMLNNIKDHLSSTLNTMNSKLEKEVGNMSIETGMININTDDYETELNRHKSVINSSYLSPVHASIINSTAGSNTQKLNEYLHRHSTEISDSVFYNKNVDMDLSDEKSTLCSADSMYATSTNENRDNTNDTELSRTLLENSHYLKATQISKIGTTNNQTVSNNDRNAAEKLQQKLAHLHQMGSSLKTNNTELTEMMKNHSKKLKKLKSQTNKHESVLDCIIND